MGAARRREVDYGLAVEDVRGVGRTGTGGGLADVAAVPALISVLRSAAEDARCASVIALGRIRDPRGIAEIRRVRESDPQLFVRQAAARILEEAP